MITPQSIIVLNKFYNSWLRFCMTFLRTCREARPAVILVGVLVHVGKTLLRGSVGTRLRNRHIGGELELPIQLAQVQVVLLLGVLITVVLVHYRGFVTLLFLLFLGQEEGRLFPLAKILFVRFLTTPKPL